MQSKLSKLQKEILQIINKKEKENQKRFEYGSGQPIPNINYKKKVRRFYIRRKLNNKYCRASISRAIKELCLKQFLVK